MLSKTRQLFSATNTGKSKMDNVIGQKLSAGASGGTVITGISTYFELLPGLLGCLASLAGMTLSIVLIYWHIKTKRLECEILRRKLADQSSEHRSS